MIMCSLMLHVLALASTVIVSGAAEARTTVVEAAASQFAAAQHAEAPHAPPAEEDDPTASVAVRALLTRMLPAAAAAKFTLSLLPTAADQHPSFEIRASALDAPLIAGTSGVALASGVYYYLKTYCGCSVRLFFP